MERFDTRLDTWGEALENKELKIPTELTGGIVFLLFGLAMMLVMPRQVAVAGRDVVNGRVFPTLLLSVMMLCCVLLIGKELYRLAKKQPISWKTINLLVEVKAVVIFLILLATYLLCRVTGLFVVGACFCCLGFLLYFRCRRPSYYAVTLSMAVAIWAVFRFVLDVKF